MMMIMSEGREFCRNPFRFRFLGFRISGLVAPVRACTSGVVRGAEVCEVVEHSYQS